jgi:hypothetical protein
MRAPRIFLICVWLALWLSAAASFAASIEGASAKRDSWEKRYTAELPVWFHSIFRKDGTPEDSKEVAVIERFTGKRGPSQE